MRGGMRRLISLVAAAVSLAVLSPVADAAGAPYCQPGQTPQFKFGFAGLAQAGVPMGNSVECEHANPSNGDTLQQTSTGLSFYRKSTNTPTFTDGFNHWALTTSGMVTWTGSSIDPPNAAVPASLPPQPTPRAEPPLAPTFIDVPAFTTSVQCKLWLSINEHLLPTDAILPLYAGCLEMDFRPPLP